MGSIINPNEKQTWAITAQGITVMGKTKSYNTYEEMLQSSDPGLINYVTDASGDPTVHSGFAVYRYANGIFTKVYEGEMMDPDLGMAFEWSKIVNGPTATPTDIDAAVVKTQPMELQKDDTGRIVGLAVNGILLATEKQITELEGKTAGALHFKGVVENKAALPTEGNVQGDVYVDKEGKEYVYVDGTGFEEFGSITDLTNYYTKDEITSILATYLPLTNGVFSGLVYMEEAATSNAAQNIIVLGSNAIMNRISIGQQDPTGFDADKLYSFKYFEAGPLGMKGFVDYLKSKGVDDAITSAIRTNGVQIQDTGKKISDIPFYQTFQNSNDDAPRKTIQLANHDTISGITTNGSGVNIAMVSKWDKVDLGSASIELNLNSSDRPTLNDVDPIVVQSDLADYAKFEPNTSDPTRPDRKVLTLKNDDNICGYTTAGGSVNLAMVSKWDVADFGSTSVHMNLNSKDAITVNDADVVVTSANIGEYVPAIDLSGYYTKVEVDQKIAGVFTYKGVLATVEELQSVEAPVTGWVYHITATGAEYAYNGSEWEELGSEVDFSAYAKTEDVTAAIEAAKSDLEVKIDANKVNLGEGTPNMFVITNNDGTIKASGYKMGGAAFADSVSVNTAATEAAVSALLATKVDKVDGKSLMDDAEITRLASVNNYDDTEVQNSITQLQTNVATKVDANGAISAVDNKYGLQVYNQTMRFAKNRVPGMLEVDGETYTPQAGDFVFLNSGTEDDPDPAIPHKFLKNLEILLDGIFKGPDYTAKPNDQALGNIVFHTAPTSALPDGGAVVVNSTNGMLFIDTDEYASPIALVNYLKGLDNAQKLQFIQDHMVITPDGKIADRALNLDLSVYAKTEDVTADLEGKVDKVAGKSLVDDTEIARLATVTNYDDTTLSTKVANAEGNVISISDRLAALEAQIVTLKQTDVAAVTSSADLAQADRDLIITIAEPITGTTTVEGKSIEVKQLTTNNATTVFKTEGDVTMKNLTTTGDLPKTTANAQVRIVSGDYVRITDSAINQTGYNAIEIGLGTGSGPGATKSIVIDNVKFNSTLTNNAISIFATEDGSVITISNCTFTKCSNPIRLSNATGGKVTINLVNCEFTEWDSNPDWAGILIMQDYTSSSVEAIQTNNLFGPDKVTINVINCTHAGEKIVAPANIADVCGTKNAATQLFYVWSNEEGFVAYDAERYPVINIQ